MQLSSPHIDAILKQFREPLGKDLDRYRNHVYRVYNLCLLLDPDPENEEKYAVAAAFHDLGIWTDKTFDYLDASVKVAEQFFDSAESSSFAWELKFMIEYHHKRSPYIGNFVQTVETFRRADWIDVSLGWKKFGLKRAQVRAIRKAFPNAGFHRFLFRKGFAYFLRHPFRPLPMFKK